VAGLVQGVLEQSELAHAAVVTWAMIFRRPVSHEVEGVALLGGGGDLARTLCGCTL
jgi:hypothetical protein